MKVLNYSYVKYSPRVPLLLLIVNKIRRDNFDLFFFLFLSFFLSSCLPSPITQKVFSVYERSGHQTTALSSKIFLFLGRAACELRSTSLAPNAHRSGFPILHIVHNYTHNPKTNGRMRMFYPLNDFSTIGDIYSLG